MQVTKLKCLTCGARVNPLWQACILCKHPLESPTLEEILSMPLSEFRKAGLLVRVRCGHLDGEEVYIASSEKEAEIGRSEGLVVYLADELIELVKGKPSPDELRQLHTIKKEFGGRLIETTDRGAA